MLCTRCCLKIDAPPLGPAWARHDAACGGSPTRVATLRAAVAHAHERAARDRTACLVWVQPEPGLVFVRTAEEGEPEGALLLGIIPNPWSTP